MKKHLTIRLEEETIKQLKVYCIENGTTITDLITECINKTIEEEKGMRTLEIRYDNNDASWWDIWNTNAKTLEEAWKEMDERPTETGTIRFQDGDGVTMRVNNEE